MILGRVPKLRALIPGGRSASVPRGWEAVDTCEQIEAIAKIRSRDQTLIASITDALSPMREVVHRYGERLRTAGGSRTIRLTWQSLPQIRPPERSGSTSIPRSSGIGEAEREIAVPYLPIVTLGSYVQRETRRENLEEVDFRRCDPSLPAHPLSPTQSSPDRFRGLELRHATRTRSEPVL